MKKKTIEIQEMRAEAIRAWKKSADLWEKASDEFAEHPSVPSCGEVRDRAAMSFENRARSLERVIELMNEWDVAEMEDKVGRAVGKAMKEMAEKKQESDASTPPTVSEP